MPNEAAKLMEVNAKNMIALHFRRRLHQYIRFRYAPEGKLEMKHKDAKRLVDSCFRVKTEPVLDEDGQPAGRTTPVWTEWDDTSDPVEKELRKWLGIVPWHFSIRANSGHFVRKLSDMLSWMEKFVEKHPSQKGARVYSLLPVATSFQAAYVKINGSTLHGIFARLLKKHPNVEEYLRDELNIVPTNKITSESQWPFTRTIFQMHRSEILRQMFDVAQFETKNRKFADELKTNGYAVSVTMTRPLTTTSVTVVNTKEHPSKKELKEIKEMDKFRMNSPKLKSHKIVLKCTRNVLRYTNSGCKANFWNRDVNASLNMLELLRSGLNGKHGTSRVRAFHAWSTIVEEKKIGWKAS
ncbi:hypothetical protein Poli38472_002021 [Pythium oligandrum]|uniref:Uncharacterized protein n=1 Tax=Pythium oligandrum TaxID=41045 RepID=A0A8K1CUJ3_PYTOL|nr:hypothetical protein Poli38472_002021 [Pythium oligandrum]|eukprot:TMW69865.1 hypothetical protein Poli38472_002021 [Pythium oligandrum]